MTDCEAYLAPCERVDPLELADAPFPPEPGDEVLSYDGVIIRCRDDVSTKQQAWKVEIDDNRLYFLTFRFSAAPGALRSCSFDARDDAASLHFQVSENGDLRKRGTET